MRGQASESSAPAWRPTEAETIALAYYRVHHRDGWAALVHAIEDALSDLAAADSALRERGRQISHGYVRGQPADDTGPCALSAGVAAGSGLGNAVEAAV